MSDQRPTALQPFRPLPSVGTAFSLFHRHAGCVGPSVLCLRLAAFCIGHPVFRLLPLPFNGRFIIRFQLFVCFFRALLLLCQSSLDGHLADELLVRTLERCDWFARLLRIAL